MESSVAVKRKTLPMVFSRDFEALLITADLPHTSLTHDLELAVNRGVSYLEDLEDVFELQHKEAIAEYVIHTNSMFSIDSEVFDAWSINISEDLIDEVDQIRLIHGDDLKIAGLNEVSIQSILILLAVAGVQRQGLI